MNAPSDCRSCRGRFLLDPLLQAELSHMAVILGPSAAEAELNERYAEGHEEHGLAEGERLRSHPDFVAGMERIRGSGETLTRDEQP